jgi:hypothetical protein
MKNSVSLLSLVSKTNQAVPDDLWCSTPRFDQGQGVRPARCGLALKGVRREQLEIRCLSKHTSGVICSIKNISIRNRAQPVPRPRKRVRPACRLRKSVPSVSPIPPVSPIPASRRMGMAAICWPVWPKDAGAGFDDTGHRERSASGFWIWGLCPMPRWRWCVAPPWGILWRFVWGNIT